MTNASKWLAALALVFSLGVSGAMAQSTGGNGGGAAGGDGGSAGAAGGAPGGSGGGSPFHPIIPGSPADSGACSVLPDLPDPALFSDIGDAVKAASRATRAHIERCGCNTQACIADALDSYAETLAKAAPRLPPQLRDLPSVVATAARRVRAARTKTEAVHILLAAVAHVQKEILLIRVDNTDQTHREARSGDFAAGTLQTAAAALVRSDAL